MPRAPRKAPSPQPAKRRAKARAPRSSAAASSPAPDAEKRPFEADALPVLTTLCESFARFLRAIPGAIDGPRDLERALGIDYVLAWRTYKVATAADPAAVGADVPRSAPLKRLLDAARRRRVRADAVESVRAAYHDFEALVLRHAGDDPKRGPGTRPRSGGRAVFDALISSVSRGTTPALDLHHRRNAFKSNSYLWGVQAHAALRCVVWHLNTQSDQIDGLMLSGFAHLNALRPGVPVVLKHHSGVLSHVKTPGKEPGLKPPSPPRVLEQFCSRPAPKLTTNAGSDGYADIALEFDGIGKGAAVDFLSLELALAASKGVHQPHYRMLVTSMMPAETLHVVMLVPRGLSDPSTRTITTHGNPATSEAARAHLIPGHLIPSHETAEHLGSELDALATTDFPRFTEALDMVLTERGWRGSAFDIYRCRVRYPILHALVNLCVMSTQPR